MHTSEPQLQHSCACGEECPKSQTKQPVQEHERLQTDHRIQASDTGQIEAPPIVHEVLARPSQPLDLSTRTFMEQRFGHDFSQVRVHADAKAAESARAIDALAYTAGSDIVFGAGQYAPRTTPGRTFLAHELTHVIQREAGDTIHRQPTPQEIKEAKRLAWLKELAKNPADAHREWKHLTHLERVFLADQMAQHYGKDFAKSFLWYTEHPIEIFQEHTNLPERTPEWIQARGYKLQQRATWQ